tara:strand:+ start:246 stop:356 length:111 start_codon:yes stop_codon:yes gene_type:complete
MPYDPIIILLMILFVVGFIVKIILCYNSLPEEKDKK